MYYGIVHHKKFLKKYLWLTHCYSYLLSRELYFYGNRYFTTTSHRIDMIFYMDKVNFNI